MSATATMTPLDFDVRRTPPIPFSRLVKVELRKSYDTRSGFWLLVSMGLLTSVIYAVLLIVSALGKTTLNYGDFAAAAAFGTSVLLPVMGILLVTSEWSQRTTLTTFALEPNRARVLAAKLATGIVLTFAVAAFAVVVGAGANAINTLVADSHSWSFGFNHLVGFVITQILTMLGGFAFAALLLNSPAAIVLFFVYRFIVPTIFAMLGNAFGGFKDASAWFDFESAQRPLADLSLSGSDWAHLLVSATIWLAIPFAFGLRRVLRAEVK
ncbi:hypothetical protein Back2_23460 [Nocardioides baekrokdamisoli]|uniref:ABC transporter permease n=1 Tax=Nocardioides baekrokdamisoli TaxID=1804624 RepID=A0A3G9J4Z2_9ACTN|nr:ABC transporter permease [Nocardioides baekrokdamisoli]BBH18059.1 hypothetical protein Back2_23460 [Nocardioides baekrokdamisoli]